MGAEPGNGLAASPATVAKSAQRAPASQIGAERAEARRASAQDEQLRNLSGDAPFCDGCGHITVRNGTCYKCLNCGNSMGCS
jgi:ribonucleoside-diphosphate reductase alpha chain